MVGFFTDYLSNRVLDMVFGSAPLAIPVTLYVGLSRDAANRTGLYQEPPGGGYARSAVINDLISFQEAQGGVKANAMDIVFPSPTGDWGTIGSVFIADAPAGGTILAMTDLDPPHMINADDPPRRIIAGGLRLTIS